MICDGLGLPMHSKRRLKSSECRRRVIIETDLVQRSLQDGSRTSFLMLLGFILKVSGSIWAQYIAGVRAVLPTTLGSCFECSKRLYYGSVPDPPGYNLIIKYINFTCHTDVHILQPWSDIQKEQQKRKRRVTKESKGSNGRETNEEWKNRTESNEENNE